MSTWCRSIVLVVACTSATSREVSAEDDAYTPIILGIDVGAIATGVVAVKTSSLVGFGAAGIYALGGPIVHTVHGEYAKAALSLGVRLGAPVLGFAIGDAADPGLLTWGQIIGPLVGVAGAMVFDWVVLSDGPPFSESAQMISIGGRF